MSHNRVEVGCLESFFSTLLVLGCRLKPAWEIPLCYMNFAGFHSLTGNEQEILLKWALNKQELLDFIAQGEFSTTTENKLISCLKIDNILSGVKVGCIKTANPSIQPINSEFCEYVTGTYWFEVTVQYVNISHPLMVFKLMHPDRTIACPCECSLGIVQCIYCSAVTRSSMLGE